MLICWAIFLLYWFINWSNVKPTLEKKGFNTDRIGFILVGIVVLLLLNHFVFHDALHLPSCQWNWPGCHYRLSAPSGSQMFLVQMISIFLVILGLLIAIIARRTLAGNWSATLDLKKGHELVTTGIYHYIRHPIYAGVLLMLLATLLAFQSAPQLVIFLVIAITFLVRIKKEEELMTKTFPKEYPEYRKRTKALIPFIG